MKNLIKFALLVVGFFLIFIVYKIFEDNTAKYAKYDHAIDSLSKEVKVLDSTHHKQDSVIVVYKDSVVYMDKMIVEEKVKYVEIKNKYNEIRTHVANYTPTQLDSFFAKRYGH